MPSSAARPAETASCLPVVRPCPHEYTRTPGSQLRRHIQHHLAISDQPLGQRPARPKTSLHRPAALGPPAREGRQLRITICSVRKPGRLDHRLRHRVQHRGRVARLMRIHRDHHIVAHRIPPGHRGVFRRGGQGNFGPRRPLLSPQPRRVSRTGRGAVREPEHPEATAADSRASPPRSAPEDPRSPGSQRRSKQVAEYEWGGEVTGLPGPGTHICEFWVQRFRNVML